MATYTVHDRDRLGRASRPCTFTGTLEVLHTFDGRARPEHVAVYRRDDGRHVVELRGQARPLGDPAVDTYEVVATPEDLRRAVASRCGEAQARAVTRQLGLGLEAGEGGRR
jgi:hypothetical protein